jgi:phosphomevalonate kinase
MTTVRVPGNILLFGEYAVLAEGGLGIAAATLPHAYGTLQVHNARQRSPQFTVRGVFGNDVEEHRGGSLAGLDPEDGFICRILRTLHDYLRRHFDLDIGSTTGELTVDTREFYRDDMKLGFGSSAAAAVAALSLVVEHNGVVGGGLGAAASREERAGLERICVDCYRAARGGSGYDVLTSLRGGLGLFTGGERPAFTPIEPSWFPGGLLVYGRASVETSRAVASYRAWAAEHPEEADRFLSESNRAVREIAASDRWEQAQEPARQAAERSRRLGEMIGVPAEPTIPGGVEPDLAKCVGAGDELTLLLGGNLAQRGNPSEPEGRTKREREGELERQAKPGKLHGHLADRTTRPLEIDWRGATWNG